MYSYTLTIKNYKERYTHSLYIFAQTASTAELIYSYPSVCQRLVFNKFNLKVSISPTPTFAKQLLNFCRILFKCNKPCMRHQLRHSYLQISLTLWANYKIFPAHKRTHVFCKHPFHLKLQIRFRCPPGKHSSVGLLVNSSHLCFVHMYVRSLSFCARRYPANCLFQFHQLIVVNYLWHASSTL